MATKITKRAVDALEPGPKNTLIWDSEIKGFGVVCTPKGVKSYFIQYVVGSGREAPKRRFTIGRHGSPWTPEKARAEATRLLGRIKSGFDPLASRLADHEALTVSELCDLYLLEGVSHKKASTVKADKGRISHHIKPLLGRKRADQITRGDIERLMIDVKKGKTAAPEPSEDERKRGSIATGGEGVAGQCVTLMGTLLSFAVQRGIRPDNPAHGVKKPPIRKMERFLSEAEIARLAEALTADAEKSNNPFPAAAIKLLLLTGCRRGEIISLKWEHVSFEHKCLLLPDSKTGKKAVYLNAPALSVLNGLPRIKDNPYVIAGACEGAPFRAIDKVWLRVRKAAELDGVRIHDLRHSFASAGVAGGMNLPIVGKLLGHRNIATTDRYAHLSADPIRAANERIGTWMKNAMNGGAGDGAEAQSRAEVVTLSSRKGA